MDPDGLPLIGSGVDFTQVGAIHQKRTLAFINHFVTSTVSFLNNFSRSCEVRLQKCESRIQKLESSLGILEAKLSSIPGLEEVVAVTSHMDTTEVVPLAFSSPSDDTPQIPSITNEIIPESPVSEVPAGMIVAKEDPVYKRFFKMLQVGVPEPAVKQKMQAEGLDPNILNNPDQLVPSSSEQEGNKSHDSTDSATE